MRYKINFFTIMVASVVLIFSSCEKIAIEEEDNMSSIAIDQEGGSAVLNITTRAGADINDDNIIADGRIYIFNSLGKCVQLLSTNEESNQATAQLSAGFYTLYAVGGDDLSRFTLPTQKDATPSSVITLLEGKVMDDLLMATADVDLEDGETVNQNLALKHKVICVDEIEINQVPQTVTKVEVSLAPLYSSVQLNGDYPTSPTETYKVALAKQDDGKTWKATPSQMLFPSKGNPTIKVSITTEGGGIMAYSYNAAEELSANHHVTIIGTYKAAQGVSLTGILTDGGWDEDRIITFDFDNGNQVDPVAGQFYRDYYVVTVNNANHTAVLLSQAEVDYDVPSGDAPSSLWLQALVASMATLEKPIEANGNWRLPTLAEAMLITQDPKAVYYTADGDHSIDIYCLDGSTLKWAETRRDKDGISYVFASGTSGFNANVYLRPVIDITF